MKKRKKYILIVLCLFVLLFSIKLPTKADSGWDSSYDSGGWDSGSSWDSGSDWGSSGSYGSSYDGSSYSGGTEMDWVIIIIFIIIITISIIGQTKKQKEASKIPKTIVNSKFCKEMNEEEFNNVIKDITMEELRQKVFDIYKDIQYAWTNFDYDTIQKLTTDEIFNMYNSQLNTLEIKLPFELIDDSLEDFSYLNDYVKPETNIYK